MPTRHLPDGTFSAFSVAGGSAGRISCGSSSDRSSGSVVMSAVLGGAISGAFFATLGDFVATDGVARGGDLVAWSGSLAVTAGGGAGENCNQIPTPTPTARTIAAG